MIMLDKKSHWEKVYRDKSPLDVSWFQAKPELSLNLIHETGLPCDAPLIDVGGGASTLVDCLLAAHYTHLSVLDISARALAYAQKRLQQQADNVQWYAQAGRNNAVV